MIRLPHAFACFLLAISTSSNATLIFSEYLEGSSYNKALEIYNTGEAIDFSLNNYVVDIYANGATTPRYSINLTGQISEQETYVVSHSRASSNLMLLADLLTGNLSFNGDDAITLSLDGVVLDRIGQVGVDPGSEWGTGTTSTQNNTLRRNPDVIFGDTYSDLVFDPALQWQGFALDDFSNIGSHVIALDSGNLNGGGNVSVPLPGSSALILAGLLPLLLGGGLRGRNADTVAV